MTAEPIRAPAGAIAWTPDDGWLYHAADLPERVTAGHYTLVVSDDGHLRGVSDTQPAPLAAVLRIDADVSELVQRVGDLAEEQTAQSDRWAAMLAGASAGEALDVSELRRQLRALTQRIERLERR